MIVDGCSVADGTVFETDVCVIGSGPAGLAFARHLAGLSKRRVALIESGGKTQQDSVQRLAVGNTVGQPYFPLHETRIRRIGGSSWSWGGVLCELDTIDFEQRDWVAHSGWPIQYDEVSKYYPSALQAMGLATSAACTPESVDRRAAHPVELAPISFIRPIRFGIEFAPALRDSERFSLYADATVVSLVPAPDGSRIDQAEVRCLTGSLWRMNAKVFVLAGGGIENARLLMLTNAKHGTQIGDGSNHLGRCFMEHPRLTDYLQIDGDTSALDDIVTGPTHTLRFGRLRLSAAMQRRERLQNYCANLSFGYAGQDGPSWQSVRRLLIASLPPWRESPFLQDAGGGPMGIHARDVGVVLAHPVSSALAAVGVGLKPRRLRRFVAIESTVEQAPSPFNRLTLSPSRKDAFGLPVATLHWTLGDAERRSYERGLELVAEHLAQALPGTSQARLERGRWSADIVGTWHHIGTTRMSADGKDGVVDADLRVHGMDNLFAAGSSVFPTAGVAAPTLTNSSPEPSPRRTPGRVRGRVTTFANGAVRSQSLSPEALSCAVPASRLNRIEFHRDSSRWRNMEPWRTSASAATPVRTRAQVYPPELKRPAIRIAQGNFDRGDQRFGTVTRVRAESCRRSR